jgi:hypothetical protein
MSSEEPLRLRYRLLQEAREHTAEATQLDDDDRMELESYGVEHSGSRMQPLP